MCCLVVSCGGLHLLKRRQVLFDSKCVYVCTFTCAFEGAAAATAPNPFVASVTFVLHLTALFCFCLFSCLPFFTCLLCSLWLLLLPFSINVKGDAGRWFVLWRPETLQLPCNPPIPFAVCSSLFCPLPPPLSLTAQSTARKANSNTTTQMGHYFPTPRIYTDKIHLFHNDTFRADLVVTFVTEHNDLSGNTMCGCNHDCGTKDGENYD